ncbi:MAG: chemotaxis protein CheW [Treponema sp.]|nr:chemotaxis protein CheW [Treponema sp.]
MDDELVELIEKNEQTRTKESEDTNPSVNYLIFRVGLNSFAIQSELVREISRNNKIFPIPFTPDYIKGVMNFYGKPYAVVDFSLFQNYAALDSKLFLVLKDENDIAFQISDIQEFHSTSVSMLQKISGSSENSFFTNALIYDDGTKPCSIPIMNISGILSKIRIDFENA